MGGKAGAKVAKRGVVKTAPRLALKKKPAAKPKAKATKAKAKPPASSKHTATVARPAPRKSRARGDAIASPAPRKSHVRGDGAASRTEKLGEVTAPSGKIAIFDVGLFPFLPRDTLEPALVTCEVPAKKTLPVLGRRVGAGRFAECWDYVAVRFSPQPVVSSKKLGETGVDFARLMIIDYAALDAWQHEDSLDGKADLMFWGRDAALAARRITAPPTREGYGWTNLTVAAATAKWDQLERVKAENHWLLASDLRPHSHHFHALSAARASKQGAGSVAVGGATALLFFTSWGDGVFPIYLDGDVDDRPVQLRVQLNTAEANAALRAVNR